MKLENMIRKGLVIAGITAAVALIPGRTAAQEITNTEFNDGPNVTALAQTAAEKMEQITYALPTAEVLPASAAIAVSAEPLMADEAEAAVPVEFWLTACMLAGLVVIGLYGLAETKRAGRELKAGRTYASTRTA